MSLDIKKLVILKKNISPILLKKKINLTNNFVDVNNLFDTYKNKVVQLLNELEFKINNSELVTYNAPLSTVMIFAGLYIPLNWLLCDGSLLLISDYPELFQIINTTYGGDGIINFMLPNFVEKTSIGKSNNYLLGYYGGENNHIISVDELPTHNHNGITDSAGVHNHTGITSTIGDHIHNTNSTNYGLIHTSVGGNNTLKTNLEENMGLPDIVTNPLNLDIYPGGSHKHNIPDGGEHTHVFVTSDTGGNLPINLMQSFIAINYLIKVK